jgi:hypothetical protein
VTSKTKANPGQYKKTVPRFREQAVFRSMVVHALAYDRATRMWTLACNRFGKFPKGFWIPSGGVQPEVTCPRCKKVAS